VLGVNAGVVGVGIGASLEDHDDLFERAVAGALSDAVDGALDLAGAGFYGGEGIGYREAEVVVAVYADDGAIAERVGDAADQGSVFLRRGVAYRIRDVDGTGAGSDYGLRDFLQEIG